MTFHWLKVDAGARDLRAIPRDVGHVGDASAAKVDPDVWPEEAKAQALDALADGVPFQEKEGHDAGRSGNSLSVVAEAVAVDGYVLAGRL